MVFENVSVLHAHTLLPNECATSLISTTLGEDPTPYYIVGTALISPEEAEPKSGRIIVFHYNEGMFIGVIDNDVRFILYSVYILIAAHFIILAVLTHSLSCALMGSMDNNCL